MIGGCRADWEVLEAVIGQVDEPFQVTLLYTSCLGEGRVTVALDSLEFIDCESGKSIKLELFQFKPKPVAVVSSHNKQEQKQDKTGRNSLQIL